MLAAVQQFLVATSLGAAAAPARDEPTVIVLDFDAGVVRHVPDSQGDPNARITPFEECAGTWPPYGDAVRQAEIVDEVGDLFSDFDVVVTTGPPCRERYLRVVIGPFDGCGPGVGYAEASCDRAIGHGIVYAKLGADDARTPAQQAVVIAHELGHAFGLAHVDDPDDVMHPSAGDGNKAFVDVCSERDTPLVGDTCQLIGHCPVLEPWGQNSHLGLMGILGPSSVEAVQDACLDAPSGCGCSGGGWGLASPLWLPFVRRRSGTRR